MAYASVNPANGKTLKTFEELTDAQLEAALAEASNAYAMWRTTTYAQRATVVRRASEVLAAHIDDFAELLTLEMGKRIEEKRGEVQFSSDIPAYYAKSADRFLAPRKLDPKIGTAHMQSSPIGVIFGVEPWNFPYYQLARVAGPHLMAGNCLVVKHASIVPQCARAFEKLFADAGAPKGLYTNLFVSHDQSDPIVDDPRIKGVALTRSVGAGQSVAARAGKDLKVSSMELGGSDAFIVLEDADMDRAIRWAVWGRMYNTGQTCCAAKRFIVLDAVANIFLERFIKELAALEPGDPMDAWTTLGPLSSSSALDGLEAQVDAAVANGAKIALGGKRYTRPGAYMQPTILTDITPANPAFREEFFGPVALFFRVENERAAIELANDSDFGLGGSVFTRDEARGQRVASRVETGMMFVNNISWSDAELPFGGIKDSGYGRELGDMGIQEFVNWKLIRSGDIEAPPWIVPPVPALVGNVK